MTTQHVLQSTKAFFRELKVTAALPFCSCKESNHLSDLSTPEATMPTQKRLDHLTRREQQIPGLRNGPRYIVGHPLSVLLACLVGFGCSSGTDAAPVDSASVHPVNETGSTSTSSQPSEQETATSANGDDTSALVQVITSLGHLEVPEEENLPEEPVVEGACTKTEKSTTKHYQELLTFDPKGPNLFLGNVINGRDAGVGKLSPLNVSLAPLVFSIDGGTHFPGIGSVENLAKGDYGVELTRIINANAGAVVPSDIVYTAESVHSQEHLALVVGVSVDFLGLADLEDNFQWTNDTKRSRFLAVFTQRFFTASVDVKSKTTPANFFGSGVTADDVSEAAGSVPPVYIQSITYGRRAYIMLESDESREVVKNALDASHRAGWEASIDSEYSTVLEKANVKVIVLGGNSTSGAATIDGYESFTRFIKESADFSASNPGVPVGYTVAYLDNTEAEYASSATYTELDCVAGACDVDDNQGSLDETHLQAPKSDCDEDSSFFEGSLGPTDVDAFSYKGTHGTSLLLPCIQQAHVELERKDMQAASDFEVCVQPTCDDGGDGVLDCKGDSEFYAGSCCNLLGDEPVIPFGIDCDSPGATVKVEIKPRDTLKQCVEYQVLYRF